MKEKMKSPQYSLILGFSFLLLSACLSCKHNIIAEYSFLNKLNIDVELYLYIKEDAFKGEVKDNYLIPSGEYVHFVKMQTDDRGGFGDEFFCNQLDSVKIKVIGEDGFIAIWRDGHEPVYQSGYEMKWNFFCEWWEKIQHGGSHAEYRYWLELEED
jgi:hypothetical protein